METTPQTNDESNITPDIDTRDNNKPETSAHKLPSWQVVLTILSIIIILVIFLIPNKKDTTDVSQESQSAVETDQTNDAEETSNSSNINTKAVIQMSPVAVGDEFIYKFEGIDWILEKTNKNTTLVSFTFNNFSRREGSIVKFNKPYKMGEFEGDCQPNDNPTNIEGLVISFLQCRTDDSKDNGQDILVFQDGPEIYLSQRVVANGESQEIKEFYRLDFTQEVR